MLDAFAALRDARPDLRLILAPRHPDRGDAIAALIAARGLSFVRRSAGADDAPTGGVLLADTLGEMARWYTRAGICIIGGSLQDHGGHTPWEPAAHGCALIHGPHVGNFVEAFDALDVHGAARPAGDLTATLSRLTDTPDEARAMGRAARAVLVDRAGDPAALIARLDDLARAPGGPDIGII